MSQPEGGQHPHHVSVLSKEILEGLALQPGQTIVDVTTGTGGHSLMIAQRISPKGALISLDQDASMLNLARNRLHNQEVTFVQDRFDRIREVLDDLNVDRVDGVLADLGICSDQLDNALRGFSFRHDGPLDMRMNPENGEPASELVARLSENELADVFYYYGEERFSRRIARRIVEMRKNEPFTRTAQLADLVRSCIPKSATAKQRRKPIDPATRVFQALRVAVNEELQVLERLLEQLPKCLKAGGRAAIISFQSREDRRVKLAFRNKEVWNVLTKKPTVASDEEVRRNPRSRSAKLRIASLITEESND